MPAACLAKANKKESKDKQTKKSKLIKSQVSEYRFDYINSEWWNTFDDEYLNQYIVKAIENNHDLKIATLRVEQYRQMEKNAASQRTSDRRSRIFTYRSKNAGRN